MDNRNRLIDCSMLSLSFPREILDLTLFMILSMSLMIWIILNVLNSLKTTCGQWLNIVPIVNLPRTNLFLTSFLFRLMRLWNSLPIDIKNIDLSESGYNTPFKRLWNSRTKYSYKKVLIQIIHVFGSHIAGVLEADTLLFCYVIWYILLFFKHYIKNNLALNFIHFFI